MTTSPLILLSQAMPTILLLISIRTTSSFAPNPLTKSSNGFLTLTSSSSSTQMGVTQDIGRPRTFLDEYDGDDDDDDDDRSVSGKKGLTIDFLSDNDDDDEDGDYEDDDEDYSYDEDEVDVERSKAISPGRQRWESLNPKIKQRLIEKGQAKAIANKQKRESKHVKKRRMMMYFKEKEREKSRSSRIDRPLGFDERVPLTAFFPGMEVTGTVISLTNFGAYVDVGTECDGLLHVSQMTREFFVEHPRQVLSPGDEITVKIRRVSPELKKMQLTMLENFQTADEVERDMEDRISLEDIEVDDELWGELKRVTDYGAYVEVGAEVDGFLHFMDHPLWMDGKHPSEFMSTGERVRVWVADVNNGERRIRLTANRPKDLPGARRG